MKFSERLKEQRLADGLSQEQLAKKLGVEQSTISDWENEIIEPKISYLIVLAKIFNVTSDYLLGLVDY